MVLDNFRTIELIWDKVNKSIIKTIKTASSDTTGRYFSVKILDGGQEADLTGAVLQLYWEHSGFNTRGIDSFKTIDHKGLFKLKFSDNMLTNIGELNAYLLLILADGKITSDNFKIEVIKGADSGVVVPTSENIFVKQFEGELESLELRKADKANTVTQSEFDSWVATLLDGGPSIFMNTLSELQATYPNGAAGVALVRETDPAKIYVWNGTAWENFGNYQGIEVKDGTITMAKLAFTAEDFLSEYLTVENEGWVI